MPSVREDLQKLEKEFRRDFGISNNEDLKREIQKRDSIIYALADDVKFNYLIEFLNKLQSGLIKVTHYDGEFENTTYEVNERNSTKLS